MVKSLSLTTLRPNDEEDPSPRAEGALVGCIELGHRQHLFGETGNTQNGP